jgi:hypothetical protein
MNSAGISNNVVEERAFSSMITMSRRGRRREILCMAEVSPDPIPSALSDAFRSAVWLYSDWAPSLPEPQVRLGSKFHYMSAVCGLVDCFRDRLPDDVFDRLMIYMRDIRYTLLRQKLVADQSYIAGARCFLRLIEDRKRQS